MKLFQPIQGSQGSIESKETQENLTDRGQLQINVTSSVNAFPVKEARISISYTGKYIRTGGDGFFRSDRSG